MVFVYDASQLVFSFSLVYFQMFVQVYLEIPNGEKLAEALHSKVIMISMVYTHVSQVVVINDLDGRLNWILVLGFECLKLALSFLNIFPLWKKRSNQDISSLQGIPYVIYWKNAFSCYAACHFRNALFSVVQRYVVIYL